MVLTNLGGGGKAIGLTSNSFLPAHMYGIFLAGREGELGGWETIFGKSEAAKQDRYSRAEGQYLGPAAMVKVTNV